MAITYISNALGATNSTTSFSITLPTTQADDLIILEFTHRGTGDGTIGGTYDGPAFDIKHSQLYASSTFSGKTYWSRATGNHSGQTVTGSGLSGSCAAIVTIYRGAATGEDPLTAATIVGEQNASGNETQAEITTLVDGAWVVLVVVNAPDLAVSNQNSTSPGTLSERAERLSTGGLDSSIAHASAEKATAGATGNLTWSQTNAASGSWAYAILPKLTVNVTGVAATATADGYAGVVIGDPESVTVIGVTATADAVGLAGTVAVLFPDVNIYDEFGIQYQAKRTGIVWISDQIGYHFHPEGGGNDHERLGYKKTTDGGQTWGTWVEITAFTCGAWAVWYDKETNGDSGALIHVVASNWDINAIEYFNLDTSDDTTSSVVPVSGSNDTGVGKGAQAGYQDGWVTISKARGGRLGVIQGTGSVADHHFFTSDDDGATWDAREDAPFADGPGQHSMLIPAAEADANDFAAVIYDHGNSDLELWIFDDSGNTWTDAGNIDASVAASWSDDLWAFDVVVRHSDNKAIVVYWNDDLDSASDLRCAEVTCTVGGFAVSQKTNILTNDATKMNVALMIDGNTGDYYVTTVTFGGNRSILMYKSDDEGTTWDSPVTINSTVTEQFDNVYTMGIIKAGQSGRYMPTFNKYDTQDILANYSTSVSLAAGGVSVTVIGVTATATAAGVAGTVAAQNAKAISGVVATATAAGNLGTVAAENDKAIAGALATATADGLAGDPEGIVVGNVTINGVAAAATADGLAGRRQPAFILSLSPNITASGEDTTGQLTAPGGHSFGGGRIQDDENPTDAVDLGASTYREDEWSIQATSEAIPGAVYDFRLVVGGNPVEASVTPQWTIGAAGNVTIIGVAATANADGIAGVVAAENDKTITGVAATATADGLAGSVSTVRVVSVTGEAASATADGLAGTVAAQRVVTVLGVAATATADGIAGTVITLRIATIAGALATATADGYAGTVIAERDVTISGIVAEATAAGNAGVVLTVRNAAILGEVAIATADGLAGEVLVFRIASISGTLATANADAYAGQVVVARTVSGIAATATADGIAGVVAAQNVKVVTGITATATADGNAGVVVVTRFVTVNGALATATANGEAGTVAAENDKSITGITATATADGIAGTVAAQNVVTISGINALADAAGLAGVVLTGGVVNILGAVAEATAEGNAGSVVVFRIVTVVGVAATATASGNAGQVQVSRAIAGALATANAAGLAGTILAQRIVTIGGITAEANADGLAGAVQSAGNRTILGIAATADAVGNAGTVLAQVTVTISGEAASALAEGLAGTLVTERYALILGAVAEALAEGHAGIVVLADGTVIYIEATATLAQEIGASGTLALEVAATASYTEVQAVATRPTDNVEATASNTEALAVASREI